MLEHLDGETSKSGSDAVRAHGEFGQGGIAGILGLPIQGQELDSMTCGSLPAQEIP